MGRISYDTVVTEELRRVWGQVREHLLLARW
jgi:hypothetical protein